MNNEDDSYQQWLAGDPGYAEWIETYDKTTRNQQMSYQVKRQQQAAREWEKVPEGFHPAVCHQFVDLGAQEYMGKLRPEIVLGFQVPGVRIKWEKEGQQFDKPALLTLRMRVSFFKARPGDKGSTAKLVTVLESWRGKSFTEQELDTGVDILSCVGRPAYLQVMHRAGKDGKTRDYIGAVLPLPPGLPAPALEGPKLIYVKGDPASCTVTLADLPKWMGEAISGNPRTAEVLQAATSALSADPNDDIPF